MSIIGVTDTMIKLIAESLESAPDSRGFRPIKNMGNFFVSDDPEATLDGKSFLFPAEVGGKKVYVFARF